MKLELEINEKQASQIINLFEHYSEVQHDAEDGNDEDGDVPTEKFCVDIAENLKKQVENMGYVYDYEQEAYSKEKY